MTPEDTGASWLENETRQKLRIRIQTRAIRRCGELLKEVKAALGRQPKQLVPATTLKVLTRKMRRLSAYLKRLRRQSSTAKPLSKPTPAVQSPKWEWLNLPHCRPL